MRVPVCCIAKERFPRTLRQQSNAERQWPIENGTVDGSKVTFRVQQPDGPMRTFTLQLVKGRLQGEMLAELKGQSFTAKVDAGRAKDAKDK